MALHWSEECQRAFEDLKQAVIDDPVLQLPDHTKPFEVHTHAADSWISKTLKRLYEVRNFWLPSESHIQKHKATDFHCTSLV